MADSGLGKAQSKHLPKRRIKGLSLRKTPKASVQRNIKSKNSQPIRQLGLELQAAPGEVEC